MGNTRTASHVNVSSDYSAQVLSANFWIFSMTRSS